MHVACRAQDASGSAPGAHLKETCLLYSWVQHRVSLYVALLRTHLPHVTEGGNLASVIEHCMVRCAAALLRSQVM